MSKRIKLNHDENYSRRLQKTLGGNPLRQSPRGYLVGPTGPPRCRLTSGGGPHLSASEMFLHHLSRPHLRHSLSRFDPRTRIAPLGL
jgi:hypothetical protein